MASKLSVNVGGVQIGGGAPVVVQSMTTTKTHDVAATVAQIAALASAGCEIVRVAVPKTEDAEALAKIVRLSPVPVLSVSDSRALSRVNNMVVPSTLALDQNHFMEKVKELQEFYRATLHLLHVNTPHHFQRDSDAMAY